MSGLFEQIKLLYDQALYSNVISLTNLVLSLSEHNPDLLPGYSKFHVYVYYADAHFHLGNHRRAETLYKKALQFRKSLLQSEGTGKPLLELDGQKDLSLQKDLPLYINIKYQSHLCLVKSKNLQEALLVLHSIPGKQRTAKVNMALAKILHELGCERSAINAYKEVLKECPLALEAVEGLLSVGVKGEEVNSLIVSSISSSMNLEWLNTWIKAHAHIYNKEYTHAATTLRSLDNIVLLRDNFNLLTIIGECYYYAGDDNNALLYLKRAREIEPDITKGVDMYAAVLYKMDHIKELEQLIPAITTNNECSGEIYVAEAYSLYAAKKLIRADALTAQALNLNPNDIEANILRGNILIEQKKYQDAMFFFRRAKELKPYRYEAHKGLIDCCVGMHRLRDALNTASCACRHLGHTARVLTLHASVLMKDPESKELSKAKNLLEKALSQDEVYLAAVYLLVEIYEQEMNLEAAIELLEKQVKIHSTCKLHQTLGDLWTKVHNEEKAKTHYVIALNLDPNNSRATEGLHRSDSSSSKLNSAYHTTVGEDQADTVGDGLSDTDNDEAPEESETEAIWSDMDWEDNNQ